MVSARLHTLLNTSSNILSAEVIQKVLTIPRDELIPALVSAGVEELERFEAKECDTYIAMHSFIFLAHLKAGIDASPAAAALRECEEETGIAPRHVDVFGQMPAYLSGSGFRIVPVLAVLNPGFTITPNPDEVDRVFDVPLSFVMDSRNHQMGTRRWKDRDHHLWEIPYKDRYIWGVTAGIIRVLYERLYA